MIPSGQKNRKRKLFQKYRETYRLLQKLEAQISQGEENDELMDGSNEVSASGQSEHESSEEERSDKVPQLLNQIDSLRPVNASKRINKKSLFLFNSRTINSKEKALTSESNMPRPLFQIAKDRSIKDTKIPQKLK